MKWEGNTNITNNDGSFFSTEMTVIIPFFNEGDEISKTVENIRSTQRNIKVLLVDDNSNDGYDYKSVSDKYGCDYFRSESNLGVGEIRCLGVELCETPYFILLDGHCRFYEENWQEKFLNAIKSDYKRIICTKTSVMRKNEDGKYFNEDGKEKSRALGAFVDFETPDKLFYATWNYKPFNNEIIKKGDENSTILNISCILGGCYCMSKIWWDYIGGLKGLVRWGSDEPYLSIKSWLCGGSCVILTDLIVGHLYRHKGPYVIPKHYAKLNQMFLFYLFSQNEEVFQKWCDKLKTGINEQVYNNTIELFNKRKLLYTQLKNKFQEKQTMSFSYFEKLNKVEGMK